jgi:very-short-patch-repair endonuclease
LWRTSALTDDLTATRAPWYSEQWLVSTVQAAPLAFDQAAERWRHLYRSAQEQQERQHAIVADPLRSADDRRQAQSLRKEAESQLDLLRGGGRRDVFSDFYSYRYFATEGFLPGYNFPRLPVTAYIPARQNKKGQEEFLSRARFIAISEFGPRTIVYHEGSRYRVNRVVLPREEAGGGRTSSALFCTRCGYGHFDSRADVDVCERCGTPMNGSTSQRFSNLLRLESVSTYRVDRINCDEEERLRLGYEIRTIFRFAERDDALPVTRDVVFQADGEVAAQATYGPATTLRRVNLGWSRRKDKGSNGFNLDMERGIWSKSDQEPDSNDEESDPIAESPRRIERVVPFVEDRRNVLVLTPQPALIPAVMLSLQYALKRGIEARYQLEESELAAEPLPTDAEPSQFLFYEAAEGGAGVLVRLAEEPQALAEVAREALRLCHFDPDSGADLHRAPGAREDCEAACYDCLLGYGNQRYHDQLDRQPLRDLLLRLSRTVGSVGAGGRTRLQQREQLQRACQSDLERDFLAWLESAGLRLPDQAQTLVDGLAARPDFTYLEAQACVYVDGAPHHFPERRRRDAATDTALGNLGWTVIRVEGPETWQEAAARFAWVFGEGSVG